MELLNSAVETIVMSCNEIRLLIRLVIIAFLLIYGLTNYETLTYQRDRDRSFWVLVAVQVISLVAIVLLATALEVVGKM